MRDFCIQEKRQRDILELVMAIMFNKQLIVQGSNKILEQCNIFLNIKTLNSKYYYTLINNKVFTEQ